MKDDRLLEIQKKPKVEKEIIYINNNKEMIEELQSRIENLRIEIEKLKQKYHSDNKEECNFEIEFK